LLIFVVFQLLRQQGRILLRLDALERDLRAGSGVSQAESAPRGLAAGTVVPEFQLRDLNGKNVALSDFRGRRILLIYWSPQCGFCDMAAGDLAQMRPGMKRNNTEIVLVSYGSAEENRKLADEYDLVFFSSRRRHTRSKRDWSSDVCSSD